MDPVLRLAPAPSEPSPDARALGRVARGEVSALGEVYDRHAATLLRFATRSAGTSDAEDLVQEAFVRAARVAGSYDGRGENARSWLFGILAHLMMERRRSLLRLARALLRAKAPAELRLPGSMAPRIDLERGLLHLSESKRWVLLLAEVEGYSCEEISSILHIPIGTVWTRLHHARRELHAYYTKERP